jgi:hypothetical protein
VSQSAYVYVYIYYTGGFQEVVEQITSREL